jgi:glycosyltransferase involved in cell wall biosynthesis
MRKPVLTLYYQYDPWHPTIGGIQTLINSFIKYASSDLKLRLVGISSAPELTGVDLQLGRWNPAKLHGRDLLFMPLFHLLNDDVRQAVPTTLKYTLALLGRQLASDFMHFHRLEPALAALNWSGRKTLFIHNDIQQQMLSKAGTSAILWKRFPAVYGALEKQLIYQFDQILSCYQDSAHFYQQTYPAISKRVRSINNSVDLQLFNPLAPAQQEQQRSRFARQLGLAEETQFVLFAGRLHPQKDPLLLLQAIATLNDPRIHLLIAGAGELESAVRFEIQRLGLDQKVTMLGAVQQVDLVNLYQLASLFILTSHYEGFPVSVLEALACGIPVVASASGEIPRLLKDRGGFVYYERTPSAIAAAMQKVLSSSSQFSTAACLQTAKPYSAEAVVGEICDDMLTSWERRLALTAVA